MKNCNIIILFSIILFLFGCEVADPQIIGEPPIIDSPYTIDEPYDFRQITEVPGFYYLPQKEQIEALQLPEDILTKMTTRALMETCLNYPKFYEVGAYPPIQRGMTILIESYFNGFPELLKREDAYIYLSEKFISHDPLAINEDWTYIQQGNYATTQLVNIELLLGQGVVLESGSYASKILLLKEALSKYEKMLIMGTEYYAGYDYEQVCYLMVKILQKSGNPKVSLLVTNNKEISDFLETGWLRNFNLINEIIFIVREVINQ